ncbi:MAG: HmuY family protein [Bacteroidales bacterium]|jgi:hypothetical protein|nr:HmuY family protein [Bacteroidales bacterium]
MKTKLLFLSAVTALLISCDNDKPKVSEPTSVYINATSSKLWHYYSLQDGKLVDSASESTENNAIWAARKDWDIAVQRYNIRTNSGEFTTASAKGGVYTFDENTTFESVEKVPSGASFVEDKAITSTGMGGTTTVVRSEATVILFKKNSDGSLIMPPVYLPAPVYIFRSADGNNYYKVGFTQYVNENAVTGHVMFDMAKIEK